MREEGVGDFDGTENIGFIAFKEGRDSTLFERSS
jgi:hypothetical protein